jgi:hypothetical protein
MEQVGLLHFKRVYHDELKVGVRYMFEETKHLYVKIYVATLVKHSRFTTQWTNITYSTITDKGEEYTKATDITMNFMLNNHVYYEMVPTAQLTMEKRALKLILNRIDENLANYLSNV